MKSLMLEQEMFEYKNQELENVDSYFEQTCNELRTSFEQQKKIFSNEEDTIFEKKIIQYKTKTFSKLKNQLKEIELKVINEKKKELIAEILKHLESEFILIVNNIITKSTNILSTNSKNITLEISTNSHLHTDKLKNVKEVILNSKLHKFECLCKYGDELVRFNLEEFVKQKVNALV